MASAVVGILRVLLTADTAEYESALKKASNEAQAWSKDLKAVGAAATTVGKTMTAAVTLPILAVGAAAVKAAADFDASMANVAKTTGVTGQAFDVLKQGIRDMAMEIPVAAGDLANIAAIGGQFGIASEGLLTFTRTVADLGVAVDGISTEDAAAGLAQITNVAGLADKDIGRLASSLVDLGNKGSSTEGVILEFAKRLIGAGHQIGLTAPQVMGIGAAMANLGINAEAGGSAMSKVFATMDRAVAQGGDSLAKFAAVAGVSAESFAHTFKTAPMEAINLFIDGLGRTKDQGQVLTLVLDEMEMKDLRLVDSLKRLAGAHGEVDKQVKNATAAYADGNRHTEEARVKYETFWNQLQLLKNTLMDVAITLGDALLPALRNLVSDAKPLVELIAALAKKFAELPSGVTSLVLGFVGLAAAMGPVLYIVGNLTTMVGGLAGAFGKHGVAMKVVNALWPQYAAGAGTATFATEGMAVAFRSVWTALMGPVGIVVAIGALAVAWATYTGDWTRAFDVLIPPLGLWRLGWDKLTESQGKAGDVARDVQTIYENFGTYIGAEFTRRLGVAKAELIEIGTYLSGEFTRRLGIAKQELAALGLLLGSNEGWDKFKSFLKDGPKWWQDFKTGVSQQAKETADNIHKEAERVRQSTWLPSSVPEFAKQFGPAVAAIQSTTQELSHLRTATAAVGQAQADSKKHAEELQKIQDRLFGRDLIEKANEFVAALGGINNLSKLSTEQKEQLRKAVDEAIAAYERLGQTAPQALRDVSAATTPLLKSTFDLSKAYEPLKKAATDAGDELQNVAQGLAANGDLVTVSFEDQMQASRDAAAALDEWVKKGGGLVAAAKEVRTEVVKVGTSFADILTKNFADFPQLLANAFAGGGGIGGAFQGLFAKIGGDVFSKEGAAGKLFTGLGEKAGGWIGTAVGGSLGSTLGSVIGSVIPGVGTMIGSLIGPMIGKLGGLLYDAFGGVSKEIKAARTEVAGFQEELNATATATQKNEAALSGWADTGALTLIQVRDALIAVGESGARAEQLVRALWDTDHPEAARAAMEEINAVLERQQTTVAELTEQHQTYSDELAGLEEEATFSWDKMREAAERYGVDLASLGPQFQSGRLHDSAQQIWDDFILLQRGGADVGGVLLGMKDEILTLAQESVRFGTQIPENFKPLIDNLILSDELTEEERASLQALGEENFGDPIVAALDQITTRMGELVTLLADIAVRLGSNVPAAANAAGGAIAASMRNTAIPALNETAEAIEGVIQMQSPTGLIGIEYYAKRAGFELERMSVVGSLKLRDLSGSVAGVSQEMVGLIGKMHEVADATPGIISKEESERWEGYAKLPTDLLSEADAIGKINEVFQEFFGHAASGEELGALAGRIQYSGGGNIIASALEDFLQDLQREWVASQIHGIQVRPMAAGGIVDAPTLAMLGEGREPEAVVPLSQSDGFGGGGLDVPGLVNGIGRQVDRMMARYDMTMRVTLRDAAAGAL